MHYLELCIFLVANSFLVETSFVKEFPENSFAVLEKPLRRVKLDDVSGIEDHYSVAVNNCVQAMRDGQHGAVIKLASYRVLNQFIGSKMQIMNNFPRKSKL